MSGELTQKGADRAVAAGVGQAVAASAAMYIGLATALPGTPDTDTLAAYNTHEITTTGYSRQAITWNPPSGDPSAITNAGTITFGPFSVDPPSVQYGFLCDTSLGTSGTVLAYWTFGTARDGASGDSYRIAAGDLSMSVD
jgi:hypothetical protein